MREANVVVTLGVEVLIGSQRELIAGKQVGLVCNYNVTDGMLRPVVELLVEHRAWKITKLFGPEHGMLNCAKEGEEI